MKRSPLAYLTGRAVLSVLLAGCAAGTSISTPPSSSNVIALEQSLHPATNPQSFLSRLADRRTARAVPGRSRMSPRAKNSLLLYVTDTNGTKAVRVYAGKSWTPVGDLIGFSAPYTFCTDAAQDIYVTDFANPRVTEYARGAIAPTRVLVDTQGEPVNCAVDLNTGDLAVSNFLGPGGTGVGNVIVYKAAKGSPTVYTVPGFATCFFVGYDSHDNLFVDGNNGASAFVLAKLRKGKNAFRPVSLNQTIGFPGGVVWDGAYLAVGDQLTNIIYQFTISGSNGTVKGSTTLTGASDVFQFSFQGSSAKHPQATAVVGANFGSGSVDQWEYPAGGTAIRTVSGFTGPEGAIISR